MAESLWSILHQTSHGIEGISMGMSSSGLRRVECGWEDMIGYLAIGIHTNCMHLWNLGWIVRNQEFVMTECVLPLCDMMMSICLWVSKICSPNYSLHWCNPAMLLSPPSSLLHLCLSCLPMSPSQVPPWQTELQQWWVVDCLSTVSMTSQD